eukprot:gene5838-9661_t
MSIKFTTKDLTGAKPKIEKNQIKIKDWLISSQKTPMLTQQKMSELEEKLNVHLLPEMVFESELNFENTTNNFKLKFNYFDALNGSTKVVLKNNKNIVEVKVDYAWEKKENFVEREENIDWTFTSISSGIIENEKEIKITQELIDYELLKEKQPILFYEEIILYEDELHDNGVAKFTVKSSHG